MNIIYSEISKNNFSKKMISFFKIKFFVKEQEFIIFLKIIFYFQKL